VSANISGEVRAEPNLTPLLDVVFQLITFFMLVINFNNENFDARIRLPVAGSAQPVEGTKVADDRLIFNVDRKGNLIWGGEELGPERAAKEIGIQAQLRRRNAATLGQKLKPGDNLPTTVVIRADRDTSFSQFYSLIKSCQANGFVKFSLKAMKDEG
jgi:biopolymer transport protein ExbD